MGIANLVVGVLSFLVAAVPLLIQTRNYVWRASKYETLQKSLDDAGKCLTKLAKEKKFAWDRILVLLEVGDVIMPHVKARIWRRLPILLGIAASVGVASGATLHPSNWASIDNLPSLLLTITNGAIATVAFLKNSLLSEDEIKFLRNIGLLHELLHKEFVVPVIKKFNMRCEESITVKEADEKFLAELDSLRENFVSLMADSAHNALPDDCDKNTD